MALRSLVILTAFTLLLHIPFLARPFHTDEVNYLDFAGNVFDHPFTPLNFTYLFMGVRADAAGHPHPPLNIYLLAGIWALRGHAAPRFFHAIYLIFPLIVAWSAYFVAARYTRRPLWVALLVSAAPALQMAANSVETDTPALAFLLSGAAFFLARKFWPAALLFTLAGFTALQTLPVIAILLADYWMRRERPPLAAWTAVAAPFAALGAWQLSQWILIGRLPASKLAGHMVFPAFSTFQGKRNSAIVLIEHLGASVVFAPIGAKLRQWIPALIVAVPVTLLGGGYPWWERAMLFAFAALGFETLIWLGNRIPEHPLLGFWCLGYLAFAVVVFFAGSARYLMPLALPLAILFVIQNENRNWRLWATLVIGTVLGLNLSFADYELARVYAHLEVPDSQRVIVNGEWGFRYTMTRHGAEPIEPSSPAVPGTWIVKSDLAVGGDYRSPAEAMAVEIRSVDLSIRTPFRVIDRYAHSGFESSGFGLLPFSFSTRPIDHITYSLISPFLDTSGWTPTRFNDRLVFLAPPGQFVATAANPAWQTCRTTLFARGRGNVEFVVPPFFAHSGAVDGEFRKEEHFRPTGLNQLIFRAGASPGVQVGWEDLVCY